MYLNRLNSEQKELFIDICIHTAMSNNDFADKEKEILRQYWDEMHSAAVRYTANLGLDDATNKLMQISTDEELRMIVLELIALAMSDAHLDESEKKFMNDFTEKFS